MSEDKTKETQAKEEVGSEPGQPSPARSNDGKTCAILSYLLVGIIWYFADEEMKKSDFAKFHVKQAIILLAASLLLSAALSATIVLFIFVPLANLAAVVLMIIGIVNAANGDKKELPFIGQLAGRFLKF
jgi:uncharacterized membrane protein